MLAFLIILPPRAIRELQAVPGKPSDCISSARQLEAMVFYLTAAAFCLPLSASQGIPPKLLRRRYQNCESLLTPRAEWVHLHVTQNSRPKMRLPSKPPRSLGRDVRPSPRLSCYCSLFLFHPCPFLRFPAFSSFSLPFCVADSLRPSRSWVPLAFGYSPPHPPAAGFGCNLCKLDHQRHTTHSQWIINTDIDLRKMFVNSWKGIRSRGQGGSWGTTLKGWRRSEAELHLDPRSCWLRGDGTGMRGNEGVRVGARVWRGCSAFSFLYSCFPWRIKSQMVGSPRQCHVLAAGQHCFVFIITRYFAICINTGLFFIVSPKR